MNERGFTIIEVMLFLGLSGLLLLVAFIGTGSMASRQRFSDTTDSFQSFMQTQYNEVVNGVNLRQQSKVCGRDSVSTPGSETANGCLLLGRLIAFKNDDSSVVVSYLVSNGNVSSATEASGTDQEKLEESTIAIASDNWTTYELKWGAKIGKVFRPGRGIQENGDINRIALIRMPDSSRIVQVYFKDTNDFIEKRATAAPLRAAVKDATNYDDLNHASYLPGLKICLKNDADFLNLGVRSAIIFGDTAESMTTDYNPGGC